MAKKIAGAKNRRTRTRTHRPWSSPLYWGQLAQHPQQTVGARVRGGPVTALELDYLRYMHIRAPGSP